MLILQLSKELSIVYNTDLNVCDEGDEKINDYLSKVRFHIEVTEENDERYHVEDENVMHPQGELAACSDTVYTKYQSAGELDLEKKMTTLLIFYNRYNRFE